MTRTEAKLVHKCKVKSRQVGKEGTSVHQVRAAPCRFYNYGNNKVISACTHMSHVKNISNLPLVDLLSASSMKAQTDTEFVELSSKHMVEYL